jgi:hypothetical protein
MYARVLFSARVSNELTCACAATCTNPRRASHARRKTHAAHSEVSPRGRSHAPIGYRRLDWHAWGAFAWHAWNYHGRRHRLSTEPTATRYDCAATVRSVFRSAVSALRTSSTSGCASAAVSADGGRELSAEPNPKVLSLFGSGEGGATSGSGAAGTASCKSLHAWAHANATPCHHAEAAHDAKATRARTAIGAASPNRSQSRGPARLACAHCAPA